MTRKDIGQFLYTLSLAVLPVLSFGQKLPFFDGFKNFTEKQILVFVSDIHDETDCGEWGGHKERISIFRVGDQIKFHYDRKKNNCDRMGINVSPLSDSIVTIYVSYLDKEEQRLVLSYVQELLEYRPEQGRGSNKFNTYEIRLEEGAFSSGFTIKDNSETWLKYDSLKSALLNKKN